MINERDTTTQKGKHAAENIIAQSEVWSERKPRKHLDYRRLQVEEMDRSCSDLYHIERRESYSISCSQIVPCHDLKPDWIY